jgi:hypothetical protein
VGAGVGSLFADADRIKEKTIINDKTNLYITDDISTKLFAGYKFC